MVAFTDLDVTRTSGVLSLRCLSWTMSVTFPVQAAALLPRQYNLRDYGIFSEYRTTISWKRRLIYRVFRLATVPGIILLVPRTLLHSNFQHDVIINHNLLLLLIHNFCRIRLAFIGDVVPEWLMVND